MSIDADLQDDVNAIIEFIEKYHEGYDVVYGVRDKRDTDTYFKRNSALAFYRIMSKLGVNMVPNHADYRLLSKRALTEFLRYKEENMFIRGIVPLLGFKSTKVFYNRNERFAGESKYPLKKMVLFAVDGITSFSVAPIRLLLVLGSVIFYDRRSNGDLCHCSKNHWCCCTWLDIFNCFLVVNWRNSINWYWCSR